MFIPVLATTIVAATIGMAILKFYSLRDIDIISFVFTHFIYGTRFLRLVSKFGLTNLIRPKRVTKIAAPNNFELSTVPYFRILLGYVWTFKTRDRDVIIATYPKSGTTWMQEIVWLICNNADTYTAMKTDLTRRSPFLESLSVGDSLGIQALEKWPVDSIRIMKTHHPYEILPADVCVGKKGRIVYVCRNPKDVCVSYFHFHGMSFSLPNPGTWEEFLVAFSNGDLAWGDWFTHAQKFWQEYKKNKRQIYFTTYESLKFDLRKEVSSIAEFLGKEMTDEQINVITEHCTFDSMRKNQRVNYENMARATIFDFSKAKFMRKGEVGDWKNYFTINQSKAFDELYEKRMKGSGLELQFEP